jgi:hypothetical protein
MAAASVEKSDGATFYDDVIAKVLKGNLGKDFVSNIPPAAAAAADEDEEETAAKSKADEDEVSPASEREWPIVNGRTAARMVYNNKDNKKIMENGSMRDPSFCLALKTISAFLYEQWLVGCSLCPDTDKKVRRLRRITKNSIENIVGTAMEEHGKRMRFGLAPDPWRTAKRRRRYRRRARRRLPVARGLRPQSWSKASARGRRARSGRGVSARRGREWRFLVCGLTRAQPRARSTLRPRWTGV